MTTLNVLSEQLVSHLWAVSWQVSILFLIIWIFEKLSFRASSLFRYWLWMIILIRLCIPLNLAIPGGLGQRIMENIGIDGPRIQNILVKDNIPPYSEIPASDAIVSINSDNSNIPLEHVRRSLINSPSGIAGIVWLCAMIIISAVILYRILCIKRRIKKLNPVNRSDLIALFRHLKEKFGFTRSIELFVMDNFEADVPSVIGVLHPKVFLPRSMVESWTAEDIEPILLHELAHIKRRDHIVNFLQVIIQAVYFFHPAVWFVNRRVRNLREQLSDDLAIHKLGQEKLRYSKSILRAMENVMKYPAFGFIGIGFSERKSFAGERIRRIMDKNYINKTRLTFVSIIIVSLIGSAGLFVSCSQSLVKSTAPTVIRPPVVSVIIESPFNVAVISGETLQPPEELNRAVENVVNSVSKQSEIITASSKSMRLDNPELTNFPMIFISADKEFKLTPKEAENLGNYLRNGGFAYIENGTPELEFGEAEASLRQALKDALQSDAIFLPIPNSYPLYHVFSDFNDGPPTGSELDKNQTQDSMAGSGDVRHAIAKKVLFLEGIWINDRLVAIYSDKGYFYQWDENDIQSPQMQFGENLIIFAALQKVEKISTVVKTQTVVKMPTVEYIVRNSSGSEDKTSPKNDNILIEIFGKGQYTIDGMHLEIDTFDAYFEQKYAIGDSLHFLLKADIQNDLDDIIFIMKMLKSRKHSVEIDIPFPGTNELKRAKLSLIDEDKPLTVNGKNLENSDVISIDYGSDSYFLRVINQSND